MMRFTKENLKHEYEWAAVTAPSHFEGDLTRRNFNRFNGDQMLFIINRYASFTDNFTIEVGHSIEDHLINKLPLKQLSELSVMDWLIETLPDTVIDMAQL